MSPLKPELIEGKKYTCLNKRISLQIIIIIIPGKERINPMTFLEGEDFKIY